MGGRGERLAVRRRGTILRDKCQNDERRLQSIGLYE